MSRARALSAFLVSLVLLGLFVFALGPEQVLGELRAADGRWVLAGFGAVLGAVLCWSEAQRHLLLAADVPLAPGRAALAYCTGMFAKQVLPMGHAGGPALMAYAFGAESRREYQDALAAVSVAEVLNLGVSFGLAALGLGYVAAFTPAAPVVRSLAVGVALAATLLGGLLAVVVFRRRAVERAVGGVAYLLRTTLGRLSTRVRRATDRAAVSAGVDRYYATFHRVRGDRRRVALAAGFTVAGWLLFAVPLYTSFRAVGVGGSLALAVFAVPVAGIATAFPLPGGLGGVEVALGAILATLTGIGLAELAAVVLLYRLASYWFMVLVGGLGSIFRSMTGGGPPAPT